MVPSGMMATALSTTARGLLRRTTRATFSVGWPATATLRHAAPDSGRNQLKTILV
jgi:hypothetical protein